MTGILMKPLAIAGGAAILLAAVVGVGDSAEQRRAVDAFSRLEVKGFMDVSVKVGGQQSVRITADKDVIDRVKTAVQGDTLVLDMERGERGRRYRSIDTLHIHVTVPTLSAAALTGSGDVDIVGLDGQDISLSLHGSGDIRIAGRCGVLDATLKGSGDIEAKPLKCEEADVILRGSGDVAVYSRQRVDVALYGSGDVVVYGSPEKVTSTIKGAGEISID